MIRFVAALIGVTALCGCAMFHIYPNSDIACVRSDMRFKGAHFDQALSACARPESDDPLGLVNGRLRPLDLRKDPELQRMAEDPAINDWGYPYIKSDGTSSDGKPLSARYVYPAWPRDRYVTAPH